MQKSFSLACFIWNYAQLSNPAKYHLLRAREAGALGLPSVERWIPVRRPSRLAVAGMSRRGGCWRGCAHLPSCSWGAGTAVGTCLPSPSPCVVPVNTSVVGCLPRWVFLCLSGGSFTGVLPEEAGWRLSLENIRGESGFGTGLMRQL